MEQLIKFKNKKYLLVEGAIATKEDYENGRVSYAHLYNDGQIIRFGKVIGNKKDIKFLKKVKVNVKEGALENILTQFFQPLENNNKK